MLNAEDAATMATGLNNPGVWEKVGSFVFILSRSRNSLSSMKYRLDLKNGNNSQQLLEVINQGIGDSLERQLDYAHAPTIAGHLDPRPAQQPPEVAVKKKAKKDKQTSRRPQRNDREKM